MLHGIPHAPIGPPKKHPTLFIKEETLVHALVGKDDLQPSVSDTRAERSRLSSTANSGISH